MKRKLTKFINRLILIFILFYAANLMNKTGIFLTRKTTLFFILLASSMYCLNADEQKSAVTDIYFFYSQTCSFCRMQAPYMQYIDRNNRSVNVKLHDINKDKVLWEKIKKENGIKGNSVPRTVIGDKVFIGFSKNSGKLEYNEAFGSYIGYYNQIIKAVEAETGKRINVLPVKQLWYRWLPAVLLIILLTGYLHPMIRKGDASTRYIWFGALLAVITASILVLISELSGNKLQNISANIPFPFFVVIIAFFDGFNPCAFSVFIIFLSLLSHTASKKISWLLGFVFILTSALMYFIFIIIIITAGSVLHFAFGKYIFILIGLGMLITGILNIKEYWFFKTGYSLTISKNNMKIISRKAGKIINTLLKDSSGKGAVLTAAASTFALSAFVNMVELGCTAILPAVYMTKLFKHYGIRLSYPHILYTVIYAAIYVFPLVILLLGFKKLFPSKRLNEMQGRLMKLFSGLLMLLLGLLLLFRPDAVQFP